jgi:hypothetical protein
MANTFTLIASQTLGSSAASITFSSIPSTYTDLKIFLSARADTSGVYNDVSVTLTGATYSSGKILYTLNGTSAATYSPGGPGFFAQSTGTSVTANTFTNCEIYIPNYTSSTGKSLSGDAVGENNATPLIMTLNAGLYTSSGAVTAVILAPGSGNFVQYTSAYLYGIKNS